ncbi:hypothetical protein BKI52_04660 [marine bacterium AO1-C]|nr:hypothetical protein BKI52_04660 [marine bacterium AO1-C]
MNKSFREPFYRPKPLGKNFATTSLKTRYSKLSTSVKRLERLTAILSYIQSRSYTPIGDLQQKFAVSERTIFRDIRALEESGVPIAFEKDKGYFVSDRHFLPPLAFTIEEAKSLIFVEQLARKYTDAPTFAHFANALEKIKNKLKDYQLTDVEHLESKVLAYINEQETPRYLAVAEKACSQQQVLDIAYQDSRGNFTHRLVEPIGITFYSQTWHLIAFCRLRDDYRDFSLTRVLELHTTIERFSRTHLTLNEYIKKIENT